MRDAARRRRRAARRPATPRSSSAARATASMSTPRASAACIAPAPVAPQQRAPRRCGDRQRRYRPPRHRRHGGARRAGLRNRRSKAIARRLAAPVRALVEAGIDAALPARPDAGRPRHSADRDRRDRRRSPSGSTRPRSRFREPVRGACEILGLDPLYVANEGRFVAFVPKDAADRALRILRGHDRNAALIGQVEADSSRGGVHLETIGDTRTLDLLTEEQLVVPRPLRIAPSGYPPWPSACLYRML